MCLKKLPEIQQSFSCKNLELLNTCADTLWSVSQNSFSFPPPPCCCHIMSLLPLSSGFAPTAPLPEDAETLTQVQRTILDSIRPPTPTPEVHRGPSNLGTPHPVSRQCHPRPGSAAPALSEKLHIRRDCGCGCHLHRARRFKVGGSEQRDGRAEERGGAGA